MHSWYTADTDEAWFDSQVGRFGDIWLPCRAEDMATKEQEERRVAKLTENMTSIIIAILCRLWQGI
jgi:hypothetical protein